jgi:hypothetical protein
VYESGNSLESSKAKITKSLLCSTNNNRIRKGREGTLKLIIDLTYWLKKWYNFFKKKLSMPRGSVTIIKNRGIFSFFSAEKSHIRPFYPTMRQL